MRRLSKTKNGAYPFIQDTPHLDGLEMSFKNYQPPPHAKTGAT